MDDETKDRDGQELPPITGSGHLTLPALTASGRGHVTKKTAVWWGVLVSALASSVTGATEPVAGWLGVAAPAWYFSAALGFVLGALVAYFVPASKQVPA